MPFLLNAACLEEKQQIPISKPLVGLDRDSKPQSSAPEASMLTITPPMDEHANNYTTYGRVQSYTITKTRNY